MPRSIFHSLFFLSTLLYTLLSTFVYAFMSIITFTYTLILKLTLTLTLSLTLTLTLTFVFDKAHAQTVEAPEVTESAETNSELVIEFEPLKVISDWIGER